MNPIILKPRNLFVLKDYMPSIPNDGKAPRKYNPVGFARHAVAKHGVSTCAMLSFSGVGHLFILTPLIIKFYANLSHGLRWN